MVLSSVRAFTGCNRRVAPELRFEMTVSQRGLQICYQGGHCRRLLWTCMPEVIALLKKRAPGEFGWKVRNSPSSGLAEYR